MRLVARPQGRPLTVLLAASAVLLTTFLALGLAAKAYRPSMNPPLGNNVTATAVVATAATGPPPPPPPKEQVAASVKKPSQRNWTQIAAAKAALPRYRPPFNAATPLFPFAIKVVSLRRSLERRRSVQQQLDALGVPFDFVDAVDGDEPKDLPEVDAVWHLNAKLLADYHAGGAKSRAKLACSLSHFRLMHALLASRDEAQLVLEDDFEIPPAYMPAGAANATAGDGGNATRTSWLEALNGTLHGLPADWDVLFLAACSKTTHGEVGHNAQLLSRAYCSLGMVYTRAGARKVLKAAEASPFNNDQLGNFLIGVSNDQLGNFLIGGGVLDAYLAQPPLLLGLAADGKFKSTINTADG